MAELSVRAPGSADGVPGALFRRVLGQFPTGVTVITGGAGELPVGLTVGSFFSLSLEPSLVGFCATRTSSSWPKIKRSGRFCANVLAHDQQELCRRFSISGGDKVRGVRWRAGESGAPRLDGVLAWVDCTIDAVHDGGDHEICIGRVSALGIERDCAPLIFFRGSYRPELAAPPASSRLAASIAAHPEPAVRYAKVLLRRSLQVPVSAGVDAELDVLLTLLAQAGVAP